jgi:hypothetical protein
VADISSSYRSMLTQQYKCVQHCGRKSSKQEATPQSLITPWRRKEEWSYSSTILVPCNRRRWVVNFTQPPLYPRRKSSKYSLDTRLGGPQKRSRCRKEKSLVPTENKTSTIQLFSISTELSRLHYTVLFSSLLFKAVSTENIASTINEELIEEARVLGRNLP